MPRYARSGSGGGPGPFALALTLVLGPAGCAEDRVTRIDRSYLQDLSAHPVRHGELAKQINDHNNGRPLELLPRSLSSPQLDVRSLSSITADRITYDLTPRSRAWVPTDTIRGIRVAHGNQAGRGALVGMLAGGALGLLLGLTSVASDDRDKLPPGIGIPLAILGLAAGGGLWGVILGLPADQHTVYELPDPAPGQAPGSP
jgi:hypothetical protein